MLVYLNYCLYFCKTFLLLHLSVMDSPFIYSKHVTGKNFIGRKNDAVILGNLLKAGENVVLSEPPKTGKRSLIQQTLYNMKIQGVQFDVAEFSLLNTRTTYDLMNKFAGSVMRLLGTTPSEFAGLTQKYLAGTHFVFDANDFAENGRMVSLNWDIDDDDIRAIFSLGHRAAAASGKHIYIIINEFQDMVLSENGDHVLRLFEEVLDAATPDQKAACSYILAGSQVNAMKDIFESFGHFRRSVEPLHLSEVDAKEIIDYTVRGFLTSGKVIERDLMLGVCKLFRNNVWYINHFAAICDSLSKGYIMEPILIEALNMMIAIHTPRFISIMEDLTSFQVSLLKAILEGHTKFSSAEVIKRYSLNSSANVRRLKDALCKKEIITFNENDEPQVLDPLFEYWARKYYFELKD